MAQIQLNIPDEVMPRVIDGLCEEGSYDRYVSHLPEGETALTRPQFAKQMIMRFVKNSVVRAEGEAASRVARRLATTDAEEKIAIS
jgi:hypothetical protein